MLHFDKLETKPLFHQKYPFHFMFCPTSHQIKSKLTDIVTHLRTKLSGKQTIYYKNTTLLLPETRTQEEAGTFPNPLPTTQSKSLPIAPGKQSHNKLSPPISPLKKHHLLLPKSRVFILPSVTDGCIFTTALSPIVLCCAHLLRRAPDWAMMSLASSPVRSIFYLRRPQEDLAVQDRDHREKAWSRGEAACGAPGHQPPKPLHKRHL